MTKMYAHTSKVNIGQNLYKSMFFRSLTTLGVIATVFLCASPAKAQSSPSKAEMTNYAKAMLQMEAPRQQAFDEIKKLVGGNEVPKIVCSDPNSLNSLPGKAKSIAVNYCKQAGDIAKTNSLTPEQFNRITGEIQNSDTLKNQMFKILIDLQKNPPSR